jgi:hypothetical protein
MKTMYDKLDSAEAIARVGVEVGSVFDKNSALPMSLYSVSLNGAAR